MKKLIITGLLMIAALFGFSQSPYKYYSKDSFVYQIKVKEEPKFTGKYFVTANNEVYPIYVSSQGNYFIERISRKTGKKYRQYL
jgi:hypothetical protein